jgi:heat shock protein HtpX
LFWIKEDEPPPKSPEDLFDGKMNLYIDMIPYDPFSYSESYRQPGILETIYNDGDLSELFVIFVFFGYLAFAFFAEKLYRKMGERAKRNLIVFSPLWLPLLAAFFVLNILITNNSQAGILFLLPMAVTGYALFYIYYLLSAWTANMAYVVMEAYKDASKYSFGTGKTTSYSLLSAIRARRSVWFSILAIITVAVLILDARFFPEFNDPLPLFIGLAGAVVYLISSLIKSNRINIPEVSGHPKEADLKNSVEEIAIRTGMNAPVFKVLKHTNPTIFSIQDPSGPVICITAPLLNIADRNELDALVSHEFAHMLSGRVVFLETLNIILSVLRAGGFLLLFFILWSIDPFLIAIWIGMLARMMMDNTDSNGGEFGSSIRVVFNLLNPPYVFISFLSSVIYYSLAETEEFYADAKTMELTRYPKALHSIIRKIKNYGGSIEELPENFSTYYFSSENNPFSSVPTSQPSAEEREELIEEADPVANDPAAENKEMPVLCPLCGSAMAVMMIEAKTKNFLKIWNCPDCGGFWMDDWDLMCIKNLPAEADDTGGKQAKKFPVGGGLFCPCCGIKLEDFEEGAGLFECSNCKKVFGARKDIENLLSKK